MTWALHSAPVGDARDLLVLLALADFASPDGRGCFPSMSTVARAARCSERTAQRSLRALEAAGLIRRGDQELVSHYRKDKRPVVWDLALERGVSVSPRSVSGVTSGAERGDKPGTSGVTRVSPKPSTYPSMNRRAVCIKHGTEVGAKGSCSGCRADALAGEETA